MQRALCLALSIGLLVPVAVHAQSEAPAPSPEAPQPAAPPSGPSQPAPQQPPAAPEDPYLTDYRRFEHRDEISPGRGPMGRRIGFGLALGRPASLTTKIFFTQTIAFQAEVGATWNPWFGPELDVSGHVIWHPTNLYTREEFKLSWYVGGGARAAGWPLVITGIPPQLPRLDPRTTRPAFVYVPASAEFPGTLGLQGVLGISLLMQKVPIELYAQPIATVDVFPAISADLGAQVGLRWYFF